jgi:predicted nuclease of predicted toxin-antitoxin system
MKILADENLPRAVIVRLKADGHEVFAIADEQPCRPDEWILRQASQWQLIVTADNDFGTLVFHHRLTQQGVLLIRLAGMPSTQRADLVSRTISQYGERLLQAFTVVSSKGIRHQRLDEPTE